MIHDKDTLFFRVDCGAAADDETGDVFELATGVGTGAPIVRCVRTGKWFTLSWDDILLMADKAGIAK